MRSKLSVFIIFWVLLCPLGANSASVDTGPVYTPDSNDDNANLFTIAVFRMCSKAFPELRERLETSLRNDRSLFPETKAELISLQNSTDPKIIKRIDNLADELYDKDSV